MNFIYKIKQNWRTGCKRAVSELGSGAGKKTGNIVYLSAICSSLLFSSQAFSGIVNGQYNYQTYMDFGANLGPFTPGATNIPFFEKKNLELNTPDYLFSYPMADFSPVSTTKRNVTLVAPGYAVSAEHVYIGNRKFAPPGGTITKGDTAFFQALQFGNSDNAYRTVAINSVEESKSNDLIIPRLHKFVVEAAPAQLFPDAADHPHSVSLEGVTDKARFPIAVRTGMGISRIFQARIAGGQVKLYGVDDDDSVAHDTDKIALTDTVRYSKLLKVVSSTAEATPRSRAKSYTHITGGIWDLTDANTSPKVNYPTYTTAGCPNAFTCKFPEENTLSYGITMIEDVDGELQEVTRGGFIKADFPYFTDIPFNGVEHGDSGSPLFLWDTVTRQWEIVGVMSSVQHAGYTVQAAVSVVSQSLVQPVIDADTDTINLNNRTAAWNKEGTIVAEDHTSWNWHGMDIDNGLNVPFNIETQPHPTKHIRLTGGGTLDLGTTLSQGAGGLIFDSNQNYTITSKNGLGAWHGAGLDIGAGTTVHWDVNGVDKIFRDFFDPSAGTEDDYLHKVGAGTLEVDKSNVGGLKLGEGTVVLNVENSFAKNIYLTSGRGTLKLNADNAIDPAKLQFASRGGTLDLNGYAIAFNGVAAASRPVFIREISGIWAQDYGAHITNSNQLTVSEVTLGKKMSKGNDYLYPGQLSGNLNLHSTIPGNLIFNGRIDIPNGTLSQTGGKIIFQGHPVLHYAVPLPSDYTNLKRNIDNNNQANENSLFGSIQKDKGFNLPDTIVAAQQSFEQPDWDNRNFTLQTIQTNNSEVSVARNALLRADLQLTQSPLIIGNETVYIDRNETLYALNDLAEGNSVASHLEDQARYQGNITAHNNSPVTIQNSQVLASIQADASSTVTVGNNKDATEWQLTGDSNIGSLNINRAALYFYQYLYDRESGSTVAKDWKPYKLTVETLNSSNNTFYFAIDPTTGKNNSLQVTTAATGTGNIIDLFMLLAKKDEAVSFNPQEKLTLATIANDNDTFFSTKPVYVGFSTYSPNIIQEKSGGGVSWLLTANSSSAVEIEAPAKETESEGAIIVEELDVPLAASESIIPATVTKPGVPATVTKPVGTATVTKPGVPAIVVEPVTLPEVPDISPGSSATETVSVASFFTRTDNQPLIKQVRNVMQLPQLSFVIETNQINKRLGDVRRLRQDSGVWLKPAAGTGSYAGMKLNYTELQGGLDTRHNNHWFGMMLSHTHGQAKGSNLHESHTTTGAGLYYAWIPDEGMFVDVVAKYLKNRQHLQFPGSGIASQDPDNAMLLGSVQAGYYLPFKNSGGFIEPSVEIVAGHIDGYVMQDQHVKIHLQTGNPVYAKIGFSAGKKWEINEQQSLTIATGLYRMQNLKRGASVQLYDYDLAKQDWTRRLDSVAPADNRYLTSISVYAQLSSSLRLYAESEVSIADKQHYNLSGQIGIRYQF